MKQTILDILRNADRHMSGEKISQRIGISRAAVWKYIQSLKDDGYEVDSTTHRGYKIVSVPDIISEYELKFGLETEFLGQNVRFAYETDSTNNDAKRFSDMPDGTVFVAEVQNGGKGRLGKSWTSPAGSGIWMSILLKPDNMTPEEAAKLTLVAGLAVCKALLRYGALIKWPNDIVIDGKKICGILTEMSAEIERVNYIVCGIGINVNTESFPEEISKKAASLYTLTGEKYNRCEIIKSVLREFEPLYKEYLEHGLGQLADEYKRLCVNIGKRAEAVSKTGTITGTARNVNANGELVIETEDGAVAVSSGEVSVSGIYDEL